MDAQPVAVALHVFGVTLSYREGLVFAEELGGGGLKALAASQLAAAVLDLKVEIPFLGERLGPLHIVRLGGGAMVAPGEVARTLPEAAVLTPVDVQLSADEVVGDRHA